MANVKRIEVLSGAASALYGSDAIAGVINIITDDSQNKANITSNTRYGSKNQFTQSVNADFQTGKFGSFTSYQRQQADGWQLNPYTEDDDGPRASTQTRSASALRSIRTTGSLFMPVVMSIPIKPIGLSRPAITRQTTTCTMRPILMAVARNT